MKLDLTTRCTIISSVIYFGMFGKITSQNLYDVKAISAIYFKKGIDFNNTVKTYFSFNAMELRVKINLQTRYTVSGGSSYRLIYFLPCRYYER